jgi:protein-arginine kinase activator protein McsA
VNSTATAMLALEKGDHTAALRAAEQAIGQIEALEDFDDETFRFERERSLNGMRELTEQIEKNRPLTEAEQLERQLKRAIERQQFEKAAELRDRIKALKHQA